jgi:hypothetical protein
MSVAYRGLVRRAGKDLHAHRVDKFARDYNLEADCLLTFLYEGKSEMIIKVFNKTLCRKH